MLGCKATGHLCHQCSGAVAHKHPLADGNSGMTSRDNSPDLDAQTDWVGNQTMESNVEIGKSISCNSKNLKSLNTLFKHEGRG